MSALPLFSGPSSGLNLQHVDMCEIAAGDRCGVVMGLTDGTVRAGHTDMPALGAESDWFDVLYLCRVCLAVISFHKFIFTH